jgi:hypothetical protein
MKLHVVAGSRAQFRDVLTKLGVHERAAVYVEHPDQLLDAERIVIYGNADRNPAAPLALAILESRRVA